MSTAATPTRDRAISASQFRERWRMGPEARGLILVMAVLLSFGLAVLYSASAIDAMQRNKDSWYYIARQLSRSCDAATARSRVGVAAVLTTESGPARRRVA